MRWRRNGRLLGLGEMRDSKGGGNMAGNVAESIRHWLTQNGVEMISRGRECRIGALM